jgi:hypothetical protein
MVSVSERAAKPVHSISASSPGWYDGAPFISLNIMYSGTARARISACGAKPTGSSSSLSVHPSALGSSGRNASPLRARRWSDVTSPRPHRGNSLAGRATSNHAPEAVALHACADAATGTTPWADAVRTPVASTKSSRWNRA